MKKHGKRWRKLQKAKELQKDSIQTVGEPFSRSRQRRRLCKHYGGQHGGILPGSCYSLLIEKNKNECMCSCCKKNFSIKKMEQMKQLVMYLSNKGCIINEKKLSKLTQGLKPVYYYKLSETETKIEEIE